MAAGRPLIYKTKEEMQEVIDKYFETCKGEYTRNEDGTIAKDKYGNVLYTVLPKVPTVTGLALALNLGGRQAIINYGGREEFKDTISRAKLYIEEVNNQLLYSKETFQGARANLNWNYNCIDKTAVAIGNEDGEPFKTENVALSDIPALLATAQNVLNGKK